MKYSPGTLAAKNKIVISQKIRFEIAPNSHNKIFVLFSTCFTVSWSQFCDAFHSTSEGIRSFQGLSGWIILFLLLSIWLIFSDQDILKNKIILKDECSIVIEINHKGMETTLIFFFRFCIILEAFWQLKLT